MFAMRFYQLIFPVVKLNLKVSWLKISIGLVIFIYTCTLANTKLLQIL